MKQTAMMRRLAALLGTTLVAVLALSGLAWAATTPLAVTKMVPGSGATELARTVNVKAFFNHDMRASTFTSSTFKIRKQGTTTWLPGARSLNNTITPTSTNGSSQSVVTLNPDANLAANTTYEVMMVGGSSGVKDVNGNALSANKSWTFKTVTPPETTIDSTTGPTGTVASDSASFAFSSSKSNSTFKCSLDGSTFAACTSPMSYSSLSQGEHTFQVRAIDASGTQDPTPARRSWAVDTVAPTVDSVSPANTATANVTTNVTATFSEAMSTSSISGQSVTVKEQGSSSLVEGTVSYDSTTKKATFDPSTNLAPNTTYTATISTGMKDLAGNALEQNFSWTFTTKSPLEATPSAVDFVFAYCPGDPSPVRDVTLKNTGTEPITIFPSVSGPDAYSFSVPTDSITLAPAGTADVPVTFTPSGAWGFRTGSLDLKDTNDDTVLTVPLKAGVKCPVIG
jgi:Bacterial Ig-like domain